MATDRIVLSGMIFFGRHGTNPAEQELGQRFVVDIELECDLRPAGEADDLRLGIDYSEVHRTARAVVEGEPLKLTEAVAERIAARVLAEQPRVEAVGVRVSKPNVRLDDTVLDGSTIEIWRTRD
ncbi:MAG: dihydroneopterin aldolase [Thermomicrobiales bacterium]|nr:dihydroneopterin aldolase [Thermomicrobiales bacterium]